MSDEQVIQEALKAVGVWHDGDVVYYDSGPPPRHGRTVEALVRALHAAGLLASPEMRELCEAVNADMGELGAPGIPDVAFIPSVCRVRRAVRAYRAAKQPKPRWTTQGGRLLYNGKHEAILPNSASAQACAALLNALASESPR